MSIVAKRFSLNKDKIDLDELATFFRQQSLDRTQIILAQGVQVTPGNTDIVLIYEDVSPPYVAGTSPADGSLGVPISSTINVIMSENIVDPTASITVTRNGAPVAGIVITPAGGSWPSNQFSITSAVDSTYSAVYVVTLAATIADTVGNTMVTSYVFSFTTQAQSAGILYKAGVVVPDGADIAAGFTTVTFGTAFPDATYRVVHGLVGGNTQEGVGLRASTKLAGSFRIYFDPEDFSTVETEIDAKMLELETNLDADYTAQINAQHANGVHAAPQNALGGLVVTPTTASGAVDRAFQPGNTIEWVAVHGAPS